LTNQKIVIVAPEGTRSRHGRLNQGYPGIVLLALRTGAPILPVVFYGNENLKIKLLTAPA
jgi:1-acyl-sn-glycerol-3-phosphate acyltransferase